MSTRQLFLVVILALSIVGCGSINTNIKWGAPVGRSSDDVERDKAKCEFEANNALSLSTVPFPWRINYAQDVYESCMRMLGYKKQ